MNIFIKILSVLLLLMGFGLRGGEVFAQGVLYLSKGAKITTIDSGTITLYNSKLTNQGSLTTPNGLFYFKGKALKMDTKIEGIGNSQFDDLIIDKSANDLALHKNIRVNSQVSLASGGIDLVSGNIDLDSSGILTNEINTRRVYGSGGEILRKIFLDAPNANNPGNIGATITSSANLGNTLVVRGHRSFVVNGSNSAIRYYKITPTNNSGLNATLRFNYFDEDLNGVKESDMRIWYSENNGATWTQAIATLRNTSANFIETNKLDKLAWFTLAPPCKPFLTSFTKYVSLDSSYFFKGQNRNTTGVYIDTLYTNMGCDSFVSLNLFMKPMSNLPVRDTIIRGIGYFTLNGKTYTTNQIIRDTIRGAKNDTILAFNVIFNVPKVFSSSYLECQNTYVWRGKKYSQSGTYRDTILQKYSDTIYELNLTLNNINLSISYSNGEFISNCTSCTVFQWYICNSDGTKTTIYNATSRTMKAAEGIYAVEVIGLGGCKGLSQCVNKYTAAQSSIASNTDMKISVYPNPFQNQVFVTLDKLYAEIEVSIIDMTGKKIFGKISQRVQKLELDMKSYPSGNYILQLNTKEGEKATYKITKE